MATSHVCETGNEGNHASAPIAVIGFALKFPQEASTIAGFWHLLSRGGSTRTEVPPNRYRAEAFHRLDAKTGTSRTKHGHFISEPLDRFDAPFFSLSPHEAECMDPQQRWLLETSYHALENAGLSLDHVSGSNTSVYAACFMVDHETVVRKDLEVPNTYHATGCASSLVANRLSWFYNFLGPSVTLNTACSGSLVALHLACESLRSAESTMGVVCGTNLLFAPESTVGLSSLGLLSPDGKCFAFDPRANGYARGEGISCLVIKPLDRAIQNGDPIRAIIRGTGVNSDGKTPTITQPSCSAQIHLMRSIYRRFGLDTSLTGFVEAHGTGTAIGDAIEAEAIATVFNSKHRNDIPLYVGAVKSNIGHLEASAGLAGVIKTVLVLEHGLIPPNIQYEQASKAVKDEWNLTFPTRPTPWSRKGIRRASVNSFGFGGTNAHAVIDDAASFLRKRPNSGEISSRTNQLVAKSTLRPTIPKLLVWSAAEQDGLARMRELYSTHTWEGGDDNETVFLDSLAYTLAIRRSHLPWRTFSICSSLEDLDAMRLAPSVRTNSKLRICFVFTGQGAQWSTMGRDLLSYDVFRQSLEDCDTLLKEIGCQFSVLGTVAHISAFRKQLIDLITEKLSGKNVSDVDAELNAPEFCQPVCTALQIALIELLADWHIRPAVVVGHSSGEVAAAFCAGIISKVYALKLAFFRGIAVAAASQSHSHPGGMIAARISADRFRRLLSTKSKLSTVQIACFNSPQNITLSGDMTELDQLELILESEGILVKRLNVDAAYHNILYMREAAKVYRAFLQVVPMQNSAAETLSHSSCAMASSVRGTIIEPGDRNTEISKSEYWIDNLVCPVLFAQALEKVTAWHSKNATLDTHFIEIGPHSALKSAILEALPNNCNVEDFYSSVLYRHRSALLTSMTVAGRLHALGYPVNLSTVNSPSNVARYDRPKVLVDLPSYPFNRSKSYWLESRISKTHRFRRFPHHDLLGTRASDWNDFEPHWNNRIILREKPFIRDHEVIPQTDTPRSGNSLQVQIAGAYLYPAAGMLVMAIEATRQIHDSHSDSDVTGYSFCDVLFSRSVIVPDSRDGIETQLRLRKVEKRCTPLSSWYKFHLYTHENEEWFLCCRGSISLEFQRTDTQFHSPLSKEHARRIRTCGSKLAHTDFYANLSVSELNYGPLFQSVRNISYGKGNHGVASIDIRECSLLTKENTQTTFLIHPATLDCIFQVAYAALMQRDQITMPTLVPTGFSKLWISAESMPNNRTDSSIQVSAKIVAEGSRSFTVDIISLWPNNQQPFLVGELTLTSIRGSKNITKRNDNPVSLYHLKWKADVNLLHSESILVGERSAHPVNSDAFELKEELCFRAMNSVVEVLQAGTLETIGLPYHLQRYLNWMRGQIVQLKSSDGLSGKTPGRQKCTEDLDELCCKVQSFGSEGILIARVAKVLLEITRGDEDPLQLLFADTALSDYYRTENPPPEVMEGVKTYVDYMAHANPNLRVLEVGAGTGGMTREILKVLGGNPLVADEVDAPARFSEYMFTDVSPAFLKNATKDFRREGFVCRTLDIERDPKEQGFNTESYDLLIASNVLHVTHYLAKTLHHVRSLLRPGGKLILIEGLNPRLTTLSFIFGSLPGWWQSAEGFRSQGPLIPVEKWDELLRESQFTGAELVLHGAAGTNSVASSIISTASRTPDTTAKVIIVRQEGSALQEALSKSLEHICATAGWHSSITDTSGMSDYSGAVYVLLATLDYFDFHSPHEREFSALKRVSTSKKVLWIRKRGHHTTELLDQDATLGLCRSIMSENEGSNIVTLGLEDVGDTQRASRHIAAVLRSYFNSDTASTIHALGEEIIEIDEFLCVSRLLPANHLARKIEDLQRLSEYKCNPVDDSMLGADDVEIEVETTTKRPHHHSIAFGEYSGIIVRVGDKVRGLVTGDRVVAISLNNPGPYSSLVRCPGYLVRPIPVKLTVEKVLLMPIACITAYEMLINCGRLQKQDAVLILEGEKAPSQASIQIALLVGANVFVHVASEKDFDMICKTYEIPPSQVLYCDTSHLANRIKRINHGSGVDILLKHPGNVESAMIWECLGHYGRIVEVTDQDGLPSSLGSHVLKKGVMHATISISELLNDRKRASSALDAAVGMLKDIKLGAPQSCWPSNIPRTPQPHLFNLHETYVITGGLGGIGKSIIEWMVSRGARHFMILSRQGRENPTAAHFLSRMTALGANIFAPKCDISDEKLVHHAFEQSRNQLPPIKGYIQASMVLQSAMFQNMTTWQWIAALHPKVQGSINIQKHLPNNLGFTILLSSVCGIIGASGQSNYAFACAYQDALARSKAALGQRTISLDLGIVEDVGYTAENQSSASFMQSLGLQTISPGYLHAILEHYCDKELKFRGGEEAQVVAGIMMEEEMQHRRLVLPRYLSRPLFRHLHRQTQTTQENSPTKALDLISSGHLPVSEPAQSHTVASVCEAICDRLSETLAIGPNEIDVTKALPTYGVDSLVAIEMKSWFKQVLHADLPIFEILSNEPIEVLAVKILNGSVK